MGRSVIIEPVENCIFIIRSQKVMLSTHLAKLYGVEVKVLIQAVKRNVDRFPEDFMFRLTLEEARSLRSQFVTLNRCKKIGEERSLKRGEHFKYAPYAFTVQGVAMLSSVLNSKRAVQINIIIMRAFVKLREILSTHRELAYKLSELEKKFERHDAEIQAILSAIRQLMTPPESPKRRIGFKAD